MVGGGGQGDPVRTRSGGAGPACWSAVGVAAARRDGPEPGSRSDAGVEGMQCRLHWWSVVTDTNLPRLELFLI